ncbi:outer membrane protein assembly factor BamE [Succinimonas amylolytica]|uniref:outer membrane protein assembly factor BamE n=1 Tax=Succinimonas amylolytica TaxID=83769 RepID=UPI0023A81870
MKIIFAVLLLLTLAPVLNSCAYRPDLYQGNFTEQKDVNLLRRGMTQEQVKFILGTPMLTDPMDSSTWYYINYVRIGWSEPEQKKLVVKFNTQETLEDIYGDFEKSSLFDNAVTVPAQ